VSLLLTVNQVVIQNNLYLRELWCIIIDYLLIHHHRSFYLIRYYVSKDSICCAIKQGLKWNRRDVDIYKYKEKRGILFPL